MQDLEFSGPPETRVGRGAVVLEETLRGLSIAEGGRQFQEQIGLMLEKTGVQV